jgi:hypothetical protein
MSEMITPQPPPAPLPSADTGAPAMSTPETLSSIFFEPGRTFEALRHRPRFLVAALIMAALATVFTIVLFQKIGFEDYMRAQVESSPRTEQMTPEQKEQAIRIQTSLPVKALTYGAPFLVILILFAVGGALYMLGAMAMAGAMSYKQALAVWVYSSFPPAILGGVASFVILLLKSKDDIDPSRGGGNLVRANLGVLVGPDASPILTALLGSFDVFTFYGMFLGALGLRKVARLSSGSAWTVVIGLWIVGIVLKIAWAAIFGKSM